MLNGLWEKDVTTVPPCLDTESDGNNLVIGRGVDVPLSVMGVM